MQRLAENCSKLLKKAQKIAENQGKVSVTIPQSLNVNFRLFPLEST